MSQVPLSGRTGKRARHSRLRPVLLLTGATGRVGTALLPRLTARGEAVRCLVRDPRRLGPARVRVQIALGDLADPGSFRHALRGVRTVVTSPERGATSRRPASRSSTASPPG